MDASEVTYELPRVSLEHVALARGMLARGDHPMDVATCLGVPPLLVALIQRGGALPDIAPAPRSALPPKASYSSLPAAAEALQRLAKAEAALQDAGHKSRSMLH